MKEIRYFYVPDAAEKTELPPDEAAHALRVLRLKTGDELFLMDGKGTFYRAEISLAQSKKCFYNILETFPQQPMWQGTIHLAIAPTKDIGRMEWLAEKATEIGFDELSFLECRFSERKTLRDDRIDRIVVSAMKQSRKGWKPKVNGMISFDKFISCDIPGMKYICHCYEEISRSDLFAELKAAPTDTPITIMVGPEGDFSKDEVLKAVDRGFVPVSLGSARLRTETAGLFSVMLSQTVRRNESIPENKGSENKE